MTLASCAFFMGLVAFVAYQKTKGEVDTKEGYFLAGRGLTLLGLISALFVSLGGGTTRTPKRYRYYG